MLKSISLILLLTVGSIYAKDDLLSTNYSPEKVNNTQENRKTRFGSELIYSARQEEKDDISKSKYKPGFRLTYNMPIRNRWSIDSQISYRSFNWETEKSEKVVLNPAQNLQINSGVMYINGNRIDIRNTPNIIASSTDYFSQQLDIYDLGIFTSYMVSYKKFTAKPALGIDASLFKSKVQKERNDPTASLIFRQGRPVVELDESLKSWSTSDGSTLTLAPAIGAFIEQKLFNVVSLSGFGNINLSLEMKGNVGIQATIPLRSKSILSIGGGFDAQKRWVGIEGHSKTHPMVIFGYSALLSFDY